MCVFVLVYSYFNLCVICSVSLWVGVIVRFSGVKVGCSVLLLFRMLGVIVSLKVMVLFELVCVDISMLCFVVLVVSIVFCIEVRLVQFLVVSVVVRGVVIFCLVMFLLKWGCDVLMRGLRIFVVVIFNLLFWVCGVKGGCLMVCYWYVKQFLFDMIYFCVFCCYVVKYLVNRCIDV